MLLGHYYNIAFFFFFFLSLNLFLFSMMKILVSRQIEPMLGSNFFLITFPKLIFNHTFMKLTNFINLSIIYVIIFYQNLLKIRTVHGPIRLVYLVSAIIGFKINHGTEPKTVQPFLSLKPFFIFFFFDEKFSFQIDCPIFVPNFFKIIFSKLIFN